jgi:hypothetical protein
LGESMCGGDKDGDEEAKDVLVLHG